MSSRAPAPMQTAKAPHVTLVAGHVLHRQCACGQHTIAGGECEECRKEKIGAVRRQASGLLASVRVPAIVDNVLRSPGHPLDHETRAFFEPHFDYDFTRVRLHTDNAAAESARSVNASAYTVGDHIAFQTGLYDPSSVSGRQLLAHELTHVVQNHNSGAQATQSLNAISHPADGSEQEASNVAHRVLHGNLVNISGPATGIVHRDAADVAKDVGIVAGIAAVGTGAGLGIAALAGAFNSKEKKLAKELQTLIDGAMWKEIRKRVYPKESAAGIKRAKERKAGTRPDLTGLGRIRSLEHFAAAVRGIQRRWATSPDDRVNMLKTAANAELEGADVPGFLHMDKMLMEFKGFFSPRQWSFTVSQELVTSGTLNNTDAAELANTTMHESRHAEQDFLAARYAAGVQHVDSPTIVAEHHIPAQIADKAVAKKFDAGTDPAVVSQGRRMNQATVTEGAQNQAISDDDGLSDLATKRGEAQAALQTLKSNPTAQTFANATAKRDALRAQITVVEQKYGLYRNIPYEADAHEVGDAAGEAFKGWPK
jgi:hypothetical protein